MKQTPIHEAHNPELLALIPPAATMVVEFGCSSGALAREYKKINPACQYIGIDIDPEYTKLAKRYCDKTLTADLEQLDNSFFQEHNNCEAWIFGDTLEHLKDPWKILRDIRNNITTQGCVIACIPNAQHWSVIARMCAGEFKYEDSGLLDRTHLRWFTRKTIVQMFEATGFQITSGTPRVFDEPMRDVFLPMIGEIAEAAGASAEEAINDSMAIQYVVRATPI